MALPRLLGGLGRRFGSLWASYTTANLADGIVLVGFPLIAVQLTRSPVLVAGTTVALTLPWFLFGLFAGALADRLDRRALMLYASVPRVLVLVLLVVSAWWGVLGLPFLYACAFVVGTAETLFDTSGQTLLPMLVDRHLLRRANGRLFGSRIVMNNFVGAPVAGVLVGLGVAAAVLAPAVLYAAAPIALLGLKGSYRPRRHGHATVRADIRSGVLELWRNATVRTLAAFAGVANLADEAFYSVFVLYAVGAGSALHLPASGYGLLLASGAVGATIGSLTVERLARYVRTKPLLVAAALAMAGGLVAPALFPNLPVVAGALLLAGFGGATLSVVVISLRQEIVPEGILGRVSAGFRLISFGARPVGGILGGLLAAGIGLRPLFLLCGVVLLLAVPLIAGTRLPERTAGG